ncbi:hypothetical protein SDC9_149877 [bioreactor metagenome]|uniref:Adenosylcobinamide kinase n=1 Tax=bioreactor metagenome TaxID=1076179 RepID=A0A645EKZ3_9ZZZZ
MKLLLSGGAKNGKSMYAQHAAKRLAGNGPLYYIATMEPCDEEDLARILRHRREREGWGFETLEWGREIGLKKKGANKDGTFLLDSVTALLANELFRADGTVDAAAPGRVAMELVTLADSVRHIIFVSDTIFSDAANYGAYTQQYRRGLAFADRKLAACCDAVAELCAGQSAVYKGELLL